MKRKSKTVGIKKVKFLSISAYFAAAGRIFLNISKNFNQFRGQKPHISINFVRISGHISIFFYLLFFPNVFSAQLTVPDSLIAKRTLYLVPQGSAPSSPQAGRIYYDDSENAVKYWDGSRWVSLSGGEDRSVATVIVAASDSLDTYDDAGTKKNDKADLTCQGANDEAVIQDAIDNYLPSEGGAVYLLEGTYNLSNTVNINKDNVSLIGAGKGTVLKESSSMWTIINASGTSSDPLVGILISQLKIEGEEIKFNYVENSVITKIWVENVSGCVFGGSNRKHIIFSENSLKASSGSGGHLLVEDSNIFANNIFEGLELWFSFSSNNSIAEGNIFTMPVAYMMAVIYNQGEENIIMGNIIHNSSEDGIGLFGGAKNNIICANNIFDVKNSGITVKGEENLISSNLIRLLSSNNAKGIYLTDYNKNLVVGNSIKQEANTYPLSLSNSDENLIASNYLDYSGTSTYGIYITNTSSNNYLVGNQLITTSDPPREVQDNGTETQYTQKEKITIERQTFTLSSSPATLEAAVTPRGYVVFETGGNNYDLGTSDGSVNAINDGKAVGDTLILEGPSSGSVEVKNGANVLLNGGGDITLSAEDTLTLLWNGEDWVEIAHSDN